jgi:hypothetical protein
MRLTPYPWAILAVLLGAAPSVAAPKTAPSNSAAPFNQYKQYKAEGDRARLAQLWEAALAAYDKALAIRYDAVVMGRAGLVLAKLERFDLAARLLQRAANDTAADIDPAERQLFFAEFLRSADQVCRVDVHIDQANARVEIDGKESVDGRADFFVYLNPGVHTIFAEKQGFHDAGQTLVTDRSCKRKIALIMQPVSIEQLSLDKYLKVVPQNSLPGDGVRESIGTKQPLYDAKLAPNPYEPSLKRWFVGGGGVWIPFFATPGIGVGLLAHGGARLHSNFEIGLETKAAVHLLTVGTDQTDTVGSTYLWSIGLPVCGRLRDRFFFCAVPQWSTDYRRNIASVVSQKAGLGGRLGLEFHLTNRFHLRPYGEITGFLNLPLSETMDGRVNREGSSVFFSVGMTVAFF